MMPAGCECAAVTLGHIEPSDCQQFSLGCNTDSPYGPCMASEEGACHVYATGGYLS
jgi:hydrogenase expression/formation protein HypD